MAKAAIALDVLGGDHGPEEIIKGAREALPEIQSNIVLVGPEAEIRAQASDILGDRVSIEPATESIKMDEKAVMAVRDRTDSSIAVAARLCRSGGAQAMVSAGNTGAVMATALLTLGRITGIKRPAIAVVIPALERPVVLLDVGANADCKPEYLVDYSILGTVFANEVLGRPEPTVGLINIGEEPSKGSELYREAHSLLRQAPINFFGNVEGKDLAQAKVDVYVCDGFTGNVILKLLEGISSAFFRQIKEILGSSLSRKAAAALLLPALMEFKDKLDYEEYGGAQLLGINGVCIITHGNARAKAIKNALKVAERTIDNRMIEKIADRVGKIKGS